MAVTLETASTPWVPPDHRISLAEVAPNYWAVTATYGFMQRPDLPALMKLVAARHGCPDDVASLTYFIGMERIVPREDGNGLPRWIEAPFAVMLRNCARVTDYLRVPPDQVVDLGRQVSI